MSIVVQHIVVIELAGNFSQRAAEGDATVPSDPISKFFDWVFGSGVFVCAVLASPRDILNKRRKSGWPEVTVSRSVAMKSRKVLENTCKSGFELVVGTRSELNNAIQVFSEMGYHEVGRCVYDSGDQFDPLKAAWNKENLSRAIAVADRLTNGVLCLFAHDADPVYLLIRKEA